jgi:RNA polymerase sigma-70 factor (ECF subfamily)
METAEDFGLRTDPFRTELLVHCYQLLGSVHDAEDLVQDTLLRAWRAYDRYDESRASIRTWLYRIATNACLTALESRNRRPLPSGVTAPGEDPDGPLVHGGDVSWLQPLPDALVADSDPAQLLIARGRLRLAFVAAVQLLPARQRAVLILRDVLDWSAAETAAALATTPTAVNSALQRARSRMDGLVDDQIEESTDQRAHELVDKYVAAFHNADVAGLAKLLTEDAILEMPPFVNWYTGPSDYAHFIERVYAVRGTDWQMLPIAANGQPAIAAYVLDGAAYRLHTVQVFTVTNAGISHNVCFSDPEVFTLFGLAPTLTTT